MTEEDKNKPKLSVISINKGESKKSEEPSQEKQTTPSALDGLREVTAEFGAGLIGELKAFIIIYECQDDNGMPFRGSFVTKGTDIARANLMLDQCKLQLLDEEAFKFFQQELED